MLAAAGAPLLAQSGGTAALNVPWAPLAPESLSTATTGPAGGRVLSVAVEFASDDAPVELCCWALSCASPYCQTVAEVPG